MGRCSFRIRHAFRVFAVLAASACLPAFAQTPTLQFGQTATQRITLAPGPNLVSLFVQPEDARLETLFGDGLANILAVRDESGRVFFPADGLQTLTEWEPGQAYLIHARQEMVWDVSGPRIEPESELMLEEGWNDVAFLLDQPIATSEALASISESMSRIESADGRVYPAVQGRQLLAELEPGAGYRVHVTRRDTLVYLPPTSEEEPSEEPPTEADLTVPTIEAALALSNLVPGQAVLITDPIRGGLFEVTESGCLLDGGTCFVPLDASEATSVQAGNGGLALFDGPNDDGIDFESIRMIVGPGEEDVLPATALHGHGQHYGVDDPAYDFRDGSLNIKYLFRQYVEEQTGRVRHHGGVPVRHRPPPPGACRRAARPGGRPDDELRPARMVGGRAVPRGLDS